MPVRSDAGKRWTLSEVRALREHPDDATRYELVDGELIVTPSPSGLHQNAVQLLWRALYACTRSQKLGHAALAPRDVDLEPGQSTQPDVLVVPPDEIARYQGSEPVQRLLLAAEVVSPSSARGDRLKKRKLYQRARVSEYWIVDVHARVIERWRPDDDRPEIISDQLEWLPNGATRPFVLDLTAYFAEVHGEDAP